MPTEGLLAIVVFIGFFVLYVVLPSKLLKRNKDQE